MRLLYFFVFLSFAIPAQATQYQLGAGQYTVIGPFDDALFVQNTTTIASVLPVIPDSPEPGRQDLEWWKISGFEAIVTANGFRQYFNCGSNAGYRCAYPWEFWTNNYFLIFPGENNLVIDGSAYTYGPDIQPAFVFDLFFNLPDGFVITGIPEPSTWAMLLIGFASIGFITYRRRSYLKPA